MDTRAMSLPNEDCPYRVGETYYEIRRQSPGGPGPYFIRVWEFEGLVHHDCSTAAPNADNCSFSFRRVLGPDCIEAQDTRIMIRPADVERYPKLFLTLHELAFRLARAAEKGPTTRFQFPSTYAVEFDDLVYWRETSDDDVAALMRRRPIEALAVEVPVSPYGLESISALHELRFLSVSEGTHFGDAEAAYLRDLPLLQHLSLSGTRLTDAGLADIAQIRSLAGLDLAETKVTDDGVAQVVAQPSLGILNLTGTQTGQHWADSLPADSQIEQLFLRRTAVTNDAVERLARLPRLVRLDISRTPIDDSSLQSLSGNRTLKFLSIADTAVSDAGLRCLEGMPQLRCIEVSGTRVSFRGVRCLCEALPDCDVW